MKIIDGKKHPEVYISYSHTYDDENGKVTALATELKGTYGVCVIFDKWHLKRGYEMKTFMEQMTLKDVDKVLVIGTADYVEKANKKNKGVGIEAEILSDEVYNNPEQEKIIPVIIERNSKGDPCLPIFMRSRYGVDLSQPEIYEREFSNLLRIIYDKPEYIEPPLGEIDPELLKPYEVKDKIENKNLNDSENFLDNLEYSIQEKYNLDVFAKEFLDNILHNIQNYKIDFPEDISWKIIGEKVCESIEDYTPLRNKYIEFLEKLMKVNLKEFDMSIIKEFLVNLHSLTNNQGLGSSHPYDFYNFDFFLRELFLYTLLIPLKYKKYNFVTNLLYSPYFLKEGYHTGIGFKTFTYLDNRGKLQVNEALKEYYNEKVDKDLLSPIADLLINRIHSNYNKEDLVNTDILCCYISNMHIEFFDKNYKMHDWFPFSYVYKEQDYFDLFRQLISLEHFEKVKDLFDVKTPEELKDLINKTDNRITSYGYNGIFEKLPLMRHYVNVEEIGTLK